MAGPVVAKPNYFPTLKPASYDVGGFTWTPQEGTSRKGSFESYLGSAKAGNAVPTCAEKCLKFLQEAQASLGTPIANFGAAADVCSSIAEPTGVLYGCKLLLGAKSKVVDGKGNFLPISEIAEGVSETAGVVLGAYKFLVEQYEVRAGRIIVLPESMKKIEACSKLALLFSDVVGLFRNFFQWLSLSKFEVTKEMGVEVLNAAAKPEAEGLKAALKEKAAENMQLKLAAKLKELREMDEAVTDETDAYKQFKRNLEEENEKFLTSFNLVDVENQKWTDEQITTAKEFLEGLVAEQRKSAAYGCAKIASISHAIAELIIGVPPLGKLFKLFIGAATKVAQIAGDRFNAQMGYRAAPAA